MDKIRVLYDALSNEYELGTYENFVESLSNPEKLNSFYEVVSQKYDLGSFEDFSSNVSTHLPKVDREEFSNPIIDFFGGALKRGYNQGLSVDEGMSILYHGSSIDEETLKEYVELVKNANSEPPSEAMKQFQKEYKSGGGDTAAFFSAIGNNMSVIPEVFMESMVSMAVGGIQNLGEVAVGAGLGAAVGGGTTLGIGALPGGIMGAMSAAGGMLESASSLTEFIQEELQKEGKEFNADNIRGILENPEKFSPIRNKALARGGIIGGIDLITGGLAGKATGAIARTGAGISKAGRKAINVGAGVTGLAIEGVGGATGEAAARAAVGQKMDAAEIGLEGLAGFTTAPVSVTAGFLSNPKYTINGESVTAEDAYDAVNTMTDEEIADSKFSLEVKRDDRLQSLFDERRKKANIKQRNRNIIPNEEDLTKVTELQYELDQIGKPITVSQKQKVKSLEGKIEEITNKYTTEQEPTYSVDGKEVTKEELTKTVEETPVEELKTMEIEVNNDEETAKTVDEKIAGIQEKIDAMRGMIPGQETTVEETTTEEAPQDTTPYDSEATPEPFTTKRQPAPDKQSFEIRSEKGNKTTQRVNVDENGKIESITNKNGKPLTGKALANAERVALTQILDVNEGQRALVEGVDVQPEEANKFILENSENPSEVAGAIENERTNALSKAQQLDIIDPHNLFGIKFNLNSWDRFGDPNLTNDVSKRWFAKDREGSITDSTKEIGRKIDDVAQEEGITPQDIVDFILANPTGQPQLQTKSQLLTDLEAKFQEMTGVRATDANIQHVLNIDPDRGPLTEAMQLEAERSMVMGEPTKKGKGVDADKLVGNVNDKEVTVNEAKALKDQIKLEAKAALQAERVTKNAIKEAKARIKEKLKELVSTKNISDSQRRSIAKRVNNVNHFNEKSINALLEHIDKVIQNAEVADKEAAGAKVRDNVRKKIKSAKNLPAEFADLARRYAKLNTTDVQNMDLFIEVGNSLLSGITATRVDKDGKVIKRSPGDINDIAAKLSEIEDFQLAEKEKRHKERSLEIEAEFEGISEEELQEIRAKEQEAAEAKKSLVKENVKKAFEGLRAEMEAILDDADLTSYQRKVVQEFLNVDIDLMDTAGQLSIIDAAIGFTENRSVGGMETILKENEGLRNLKSLNSDGVKGSSFKLFGSAGIGNLWIKNIATLPISFEMIFGSQSKGYKVMKALGLIDIINAESRVQKIINDIENSYHKTFNNTMPNGESYRSKKNIAERAVISFIERTVIGTVEEQNAEFQRRKGLIEQSIDTLLKSENSTDVSTGEAVRDVYESILAEAESVEDVINSADPKNVEGVRFFKDQWSKIYPDMKDVALNVYNENLEMDVNYAPDIFTRTEVSKQQTDQDPLGLDASPFYNESKKAYDKKTGTMIKSVRPEKLKAGQHINFNFDSMNIYKLKQTMMNVSTAADVKKLNAILKNSDGMTSLIPSQDTRKVVYSRLKDYIDKTRGLVEKEDVDFREANKIINSVAKIGVARSLGSLAQYPKQLIPPLINTLANAGNIRMDLFRKPEVREFMMNSGYGIATRGFESEANIGKLENRFGDITGENKLLNGLDKMSSTWLKYMLVNPDRIAAQTSWITYYTQDLKKQGIDVESIDWSKHELNKKSADFAQQQVDRQQNVSNANLQGQLFSSRRTFASITRKTLLPFMNFAMNQKSRMFSDIRTMSDSSVSAEERIAAKKSLGGLIAETAAFNIIAYNLSSLMFEAVAQGLDYEESEEEKEKRKANLLKGRMTNIVSDVLSPFPAITDPVVIGTINTLFSSISEDGDDAFQLYDADKKTYIQSLGVLGIGIDKASKLWELGRAQTTGEYTVEFGTKKSIKKLSPEGKEAMTLATPMYLAYALGIAPAEFGRSAEYILKIAKKQKSRGKLKRMDVSSKKKTIKQNLKKK